MRHVFAPIGADASPGSPNPTLLLRHVPGDFNCLHQKLYGDLAFPIQAATLLPEPGKDFASGEFALTEQRRGCKVAWRSFRSARATRQPSRSITARWGSEEQSSREPSRWRNRVRSSMRHAVGVIFHDAR